jgi:hypothetical protein
VAELMEREQPPMPVEVAVHATLLHDPAKAAA